MIFQTDSREKTLLVLQVKGEEIRSGVGKMAKIKGVTGDGVLSGIRKSLRKGFLSDYTEVEVVTVFGLGGKREIKKRGERQIGLRCW